MADGMNVDPPVPLPKRGVKRRAAETTLPELPEAVKGQRVGEEEEGKRVGTNTAAVGPAAAKKDPTPPPNDAVGIPNRDDTIQVLLRFFAKSDFKHDFGEKVPSRDWITYADRERFAEMVQKFPVKERVTLLNKFDAMFKGDDKGSNLLELLQAGISTQLYPVPLSKKSADPAPPAEFVTEEDILKKIGVDYTALKAQIKTYFKLGPKESAPNPRTPTRPFVNPGFKIEVEGLGIRNYRVGAQFYKNPNGSTRNLASLFRDAASVPPPDDADGAALPPPRPAKFALLIDASLGMSVTQAGDSTLSPDPGANCEFVILQNVESDADSATGATDFRMKSEVGGSKTTVRIMRDTGTSTVLYPIWNSLEQPSETENLFSKIQIMLNRVEAGDIEASILFGKETYTIQDVGTTSNVKNASLNALMTWFANEIKRAERLPAEERKPYLYALLKRMGDWCQALSLLDRIRTYKSIDPKTKKELEEKFERTLQDLITDGYEVGLVTNDRILLAYALLLGLNVYFTTASDLNCLLYFKNLDDVAGGADVVARARLNYGNFQQLLYGEPEGVSIDPEGLKTYIASKIMAAKNTYLPVIPVNAPEAGADGMAEDTPYQAFDNKLLDTIIANLKLTRTAATRSLLESIASAFKTKVILSNLGQLRVNFQEIQAELEKSIEEYIKSGVVVEAGGPDADAATKKMFGASVSLVNLANRLNTDIQHNEEVIDRLKTGVFPDKTFVAQQSIFVDLATKMASGMRISTSEIMKRAKDVLLSCQDNVKQILEKPLMAPDLLLQYIPEVPPLAIGDRGVRPNDKDIANLETLYGAFSALRAEIPGGIRAGGGQRGGANALLLEAVKQREIFPYKSAKLETTVNRLMAANATTQLELLESLPAAQVKSYYRDEKSRPYSVIDRYLITKEDSKVLETLLEQLIDSGIDEDDDLDSNFIVYRFALLYHDILFERIEHVIDQWNTAGAPEGGELQKEDSELTEGSKEEFLRVALETAFFRQALSTFADEGATSDQRIAALRNMKDIFGGGVDKDSADQFLILAPPPEVPFMNRLIRAPPERLPKDAIGIVRRSLGVIRDTIFGNYTAQTIDRVPDPSETEAAPKEISSAEIEAILEEPERGAPAAAVGPGVGPGRRNLAVRRGPLPAPPPPELAPAADVGPGVGPGPRNPAVRRGPLPAPPPPPELAPAADVGPGVGPDPMLEGGGLEGGDMTSSNASDSSSGNVRRKLYARLRKRGGEGGPLEL